MAFQMIRFSLADPYLAKLKEITPEEESIHTFLKQIACEALIPSKDLSKETPADPSELEATTERLSALEGETENILYLYKDLKEAVDKLYELIKNQEARLKALEEEPRRSRSKAERDSNGRFIPKGGKDE